MEERKPVPRPLTPREAARVLGISLPTLRRYAQVWERTHGPLPRTPTGDRLWPRDVVEAIAEARARGEMGRLTRAKLGDEAAEGPEIAEITLRLEKVENALTPFQDLSTRVGELEARVRHLEYLNLSPRVTDLDWRLRKVEEEIQRESQSLGKLDQRLGKAEKEIQGLSEVKKELEARLRHLALQIADLKTRVGELEREIEERQRRPWWRFW